MGFFASETGIRKCLREIKYKYRIYVLKHGYYSALCYIFLFILFTFSFRYFNYSLSLDLLAKLRSCTDTSVLKQFFEYWFHILCFELYNCLYHSRNCHCSLSLKIAPLFVVLGSIVLLTKPSVTWWLVYLIYGKWGWPLQSLFIGNIFYISSDSLALPGSFGMGHYYWNTKLYPWAHCGPCVTVSMNISKLC